MSYIDTTADVKMQGYIGDHPKDLTIRIYADAEFASDADAKSVSGVPSNFFHFWSKFV